MAFMTPHYIKTVAYHVDGPDGIKHIFAEDVGKAAEFAVTEGDEELANKLFGDILECDTDDVWSVTRDEKQMWYARLSADGYMDQTEWSGPYETEEEARDYITETYDVDPDTGDELEEI